MGERQCIFCDSVRLKSECRQPESEIAIVIRKHFNFKGIERLVPLQNKNANLMVDCSTLFCTKCEDKLVVLSRLDEELLKIMEQMSIIKSTLCMEILNVNPSNSSSSNTKITRDVGLFRNAVHNHYMPKVKVTDCTKENGKSASSKAQSKKSKPKPKSKKRKLEKVKKIIPKQEVVDSANESSENRLESSFLPESPANFDNDDSNYFNQPFEEFIESMSPQNEKKKERKRMASGEDGIPGKKREKIFWTVDTCSTTDEPIYKCIHTNCSETFKSQRKCRAHYRTMHRAPRPWGKLTAINDGSGSFLYANKWRIEKVPGIQPTGKDFKCGVCDKLGSQKAVIAHLRGVHLNSTTRGTNLTCPVCFQKIVSGLRKFLYHLSSHWKENPELLSVGENRFLYKEKLFFGLVCNNNNNNNENDNEEEQPALEYQCFQCPQTTNTQEAMLEHLQSLHDVSSMCDTCGEEFPSERSLYMHQRAHGDHSDLTSLGDGKFLFLIAGIQWPFERIPETSEEPQLNSSVQVFPPGVESSVKRIPLKCGTCGSKLLSLEKMKYHIKHRHLEPRAVICDTCGRVLSSETALKEHRANQHPELDPNSELFVCEVCSCGFKSKRRLDAHKEKHMEWKCSACGNTFQFKKGMQLHMKKYCRVLGTSSNQSTKERNSFRGSRVANISTVQNNSNLTINVNNETNENNTASNTISNPTEYLITAITTSSTSSFDHVNSSNYNLF